MKCGSQDTGCGGRYSRQRDDQETNVTVAHRKGRVVEDEISLIRKWSRGMLLLIRS